MTIRAVTYSRVSSDDHGKDGLNLMGQVELCRAYALQKNYALVAELAEDERGASGASMDSPALQEALLMASRNQFDVLVVREIDRFARSLAKQLIVEQEFKKYNVELEFVLEAYANTPEGGLHKNIKAVIAEYERVKIIERTVRGRRQKVRAGNILVHGRPPYGYRLKPGNQKNELVIHEAEARIVRMIYQWYVVGDDKHGSMALKAIADKLCEMGVPLPSQTGRKYDTWSRGTIQNILTNETYAGIWHYGKFANRDGQRIANPVHTWLPLAVPAILPRSLWKAAQEKRRENAKNNPRNTRNHYLLGKRVTCALCGKSLATRASAANRKTRLYYYCDASNGKHRQTSFYRAELVDAAVWEWLRNRLTTPEAVESGFADLIATYDTQTSPMKERIMVIQNLLDENRRQLQKVLDLYIDGKFSREVLMKRKKKFEKKIFDLAAELGWLTQTMEEWSNKSENVKRLQELVENIAPLLQEVDTNFIYRRRLVDYVNLQAAVSRQGARLKINITSGIGGAVLTV